MVNIINSSVDFRNAVGDSNKGLVIIDVYATWCRPCMAIAPKIEELSKTHTNVSFYKLDVDSENSTTLLEPYNVTSMPTFLYFKGGVYVGNTIGASVTLVTNMINKYA